MSESLEELGGGAERFLRELNRERLQVSIGEKESTDSFSVFQRHAYLFDLFLISDLGEWRNRETGEKKKRLAYLQQFLQKNYPLAMVSDLSDLFEEKGTVKFSSCKPPLHTISDGYYFARSPDREERMGAWHQREKMLWILNPILEKRLVGLHKASRELGYQGLVDLSLEVRGFDIGWLTETIELILDRTEGLYLDMLESFLPDSLSMDEMKQHDMLHLLRGDEFTDMFPAGQIWNSLSSALSGFGANLGVIGNLRLLSPGCGGPQALPVRIPNEVYLFIEPSGGYLDYLHHFGEAGKAIQMGSTSPDMPVEFRYLGDPAIPETFGLLLQRIISTSPWLEGKGGKDDIVRFKRLFYLHRIYELRRLAALLLYEMRVNMGSPSTADDMYSSIMEEKLHVAHSREDCLVDILVPFRSADRLRGFILEAMLRKALLEKCGERWFSHPAARDIVSEIWSWGGRFGLDELANSIGYAELDIEPLVEEIEDRIRLV
ncbi:MAG: hypothetical protein GKC03_02745 [Methanomassiliicoccales archaeon]|nr:hypothetical protein [Methanomassiliicoccales archaeon]NYT14875.1 hypothetical protein [Methanomassiliicoccales archaeon]